MAAVLPSPSPIDSPRSPAPFTSAPFSATPTTATAFLTIPSPLPRSEIPRLAIPSPLPPGGPGAKRPKLSLNTTTCARTLGRGHTGLKLDTAAASSPTVLNTFHNSYHSYKYESQPLKSPTLFDRTSPTKLLQNPLRRPFERFQRASSYSQDSSPSPLRHLPHIAQDQEVPYTVDSKVRSILINTPFLSIVTPTSTSVTESVKPVKTVSFSDEPEIIETKIYTTRNSDIPSRSPSPSAAMALDTKTIPSAGSSSSLKHYLDPSPTAVYALRTCHHAAEDDYETDPKTPVAGRRKRQREWTWTLGPLPSVPAGGQAVTEEDKTTAVNDNA